MQYITLTQNKQAMVDDTDFEWLNQWKWTFDGRYAQRNVYANGRKRKLYLHRLIAGEPEGKDVDHEDTNKLNCQRYNLRISDHSKNGQNRTKQLNNTSGYKGVTRHNQCKDRWIAQIQHLGKHYYIGLFKTPLEAATAYNKKALELHGEYARINPL